MLTVEVTLPPKVHPSVIDFITVSVLDDTRDRQPRHLDMHLILQSDPEKTKVIFHDK